MDKHFLTKKILEQVKESKSEIYEKWLAKKHKNLGLIFLSFIIFVLIRNFISYKFNVIDLLIILFFIGFLCFHYIKYDYSLNFENDKEFNQLNILMLSKRFLEIKEQNLVQEVLNFCLDKQIIKNIEHITFKHFQFLEKWHIHIEEIELKIEIKG